jgi:hypothetical protein
MKPSDFYLGVVSLLGVLVPGAVFLFLRNLPPDTWCIAGTGFPRWLVFGGIAYLIGHLLLAITEWFNSLVPHFRWLLSSRLQKDVGLLRGEALRHLKAENGESDQSKFHRALSYLRIKDQAAAAGEVDHHMADYKLLRNLVAILAIDGTLRIFTEVPPWRMITLELILLIFCFAAYVRMYNWAQLLAFQYVCLIPPESDGRQAQNPKPATNDRR